MEFAQLEKEDRRLVVLRMLLLESNKQLNASFIQRGLAIFGHIVERQVLNAELHWLAALGAVTIQSINRMLLATLTTYGIALVHGSANAAGVKRITGKQSQVA